jgi:Cu+-exporting ATPase
MAATRPLERVDLPVEGMTCAACATRIGKGLSKLDGVDAAEVNLAANRASIRFDPAVVDRDRFEDTIRSLGYEVPAEEDAAGVEERRVRSLGRRLAAATVLTVPLVAVSMVPALMFDGWQWLALVLATPIVFGAGLGFHRSAVVNLRHRAVTMDTLVSLGTLAAWTWSTVALVFLGAADEHAGMGTMPGMGAMSGMGDAASDVPHVYFETAGVIVTLILLGKWFEARATRRSGAALRALAELGAATVRLEDGREIPVEDLAAGMRFQVRPGERVATDGRVVEGRSAVEQSMVTGEPVPVEVGPGDEVIGATVNGHGHLVVEATRVGADTALAQIVRLVAEAQGSRAAVQRLVDRVSSVFVPVVLAIATATVAGWLLTGHAASDAFTAAVAVLIIACPCALGLATPTAIMVGTGRGAQLGVIIKGGEVLETTRGIDVAVLDKTGTLTEGRMVVTGVVAAPGGDPDEVLRRGGALEARSEHPLAAAVATAAAALPVGASGAATVPEVGDFTNLAGLGVEGTVDGARTRVGRRTLFDEVPPALVGAADDAEAEGRTAVLVGWSGPEDDAVVARGVVAVADRVRPTSAEAVAELHRLGLEVVVLTGDNERTARAVATEVGADRVLAEVLPADKVAEVRRLQESGHRVAMVGDGINDAPALALADLGIAVGTGTDVAIEASDLTVVSGDLRAVADAIALSRRTLATIRGNLFWAFAYNVAAVPLAALGVLNPMIAAGAMGLSSVFVVTNSLRLRRFRSVRAHAPATVRPSMGGSPT